MNEQVVLIAIGLVVAAFVLRPLLRGTGGRGTTRATAAGVERPEPAPEQLAELELDRAMGRVSEEDYARWRSELETTPAETVPTVAVADAAAARADFAVGDDATARAEALVRRWKEAPRPSCPTCGVRPEPDARFCSNCGAPLAP